MITADSIKSKLSIFKDASNNKNSERYEDLKKVKEKILWSPKPGKHVVRAVPNEKDSENPFIELFIHFNIANRTILSPKNFGEPDPIIEFSEMMIEEASKEPTGTLTYNVDKYKAAKKLEPAIRYYIPVVVRGEEDMGVRYWGFGKKNLESLIKILEDEDYGNFTSIESGFDLTVDVVSAAEAKKEYPEITVRPKRTSSKLSEDKKMISLWTKNQPDIYSAFLIYTYDEIESLFQKWIRDPKNTLFNATTVISVKTTKYNENSKPKKETVPESENEEVETISAPSEVTLKKLKELFEEED